MKKKFLSVLLFFSSGLLHSQIGTIGFGVQKPQNRFFFGFNGASVTNIVGGYGSPYIDNNLSYMKVRHVRHFAGTESQFFNWQTGFPMTKAETLNGYITPPGYNEAFDYTANTLSLFKNTIASEGSEMIFNLNLLTSRFNHQRAGVMKALSLGQKIKAIEFGNEFFNDGLDGNREFAYAFSSPEVYADSVMGWCKTLNQTFSNTPFPPATIAVGSDLTIDNDNNVGEGDRINTWLKRFIAKVNWGQPDKPKGITIHRYTGASYFNALGQKKLVLDNNIADMAKFLNTPFKNFAKFNAIGAELSQINAVGAKAYITEYGMFDKEREVHGTWGHGLFVALQTLTYLENDAIELVDFHSMVGSALFSCIFSTTTGLDIASTFNDNWDETADSDPNTKPETSDPNEADALDQVDYATILGERSAMGNALALVGKSLDDCYRKYKINFGNVAPQSVIYPGEVATNYDRLYGWKLEGISGDCKYIIINNSGDNIEVDIPTGMSGTYITMAANPREYIVGNAITITTTPTIDLNNINDIETSPNHVPYQFEGTIDPNVNFTFKPYSITYIDGPNPSITKIETLGNMCEPRYWSIGNKYTLRVPNGVGPYTFTSNVAFSATGALLNVNTPNDYVILDAYKPSSSGTTPYNIKFTAKDWGKGGTIGEVDVVVYSQSTVNILLGTSVNGTDAGIIQQACSCITLTASNIDNTTADNRYQWYTHDGNGSFDSPGTGTYGDNGYSQTVTICPKQAEQIYYVIAYSGAGNCSFAEDQITIKTPISKANPDINDDPELYVCSTSPGNAIQVGNPTPSGADYTYLWTPVGSVVGSTISSTTIATPTITITNPLLTSVQYNLKVSTSSTCFANSVVTLKPKTCCTTATDPDLAFKPYTVIKDVITEIKENCISCVTDDKVVTNFDEIINFNGPLIYGENDKNQITFIDCDNLHFAEDAKLSVRDANLLIFENSKLNVCTNKMWRGIEVKTAMEGVKVLKGSSIKNAIIGINAFNNASVTAKNSLFDKNDIHLLFTGYGGNFSEVKDDENLLNGFDPALEIGITGNIFTHSEGNLLSPFTSRTRTTYSISFKNNRGSLLVGGSLPIHANIFNNAIINIESTASGLNVTNNTFTNFSQGIRSSNAKDLHTYIIRGNNLQSNYFFPTATDFAGAAIYIAANANITPDTFSIADNIINRCRFGMYVSKITGKNLIVDLDDQYGGEIKNNTITLYKPQPGDQGQGDFFHKGMVLQDNISIDVVKNTILTDPSTFTSLTTAQIDKYWGIEASNQSLGSDYFANNFTELGKMITIANTNNGFLQCNNFNKGAVNYPGIDNTTGITGIEFIGLASINPQGAGGGGSGNKWPDFPTDHDRVRRTIIADPIGYLRGTQANQNPLNPSVFNTSTAAVTCATMQGLVVKPDENEGHATNDLAKDGENSIDSLATYQTTYDSTETVAALYADANQFLLALEAVAAGALDSMVFVENFVNTAVYQVYTLESAMAAGDSSAIVTAIGELPKDVVGDNYKIVALINNKTTEWTAQDTLDLEFVAYQRVNEGGPSVINARNMLQIYVDEATIAPKANLSKRIKNGGWFVNVSPNPNSGNFMLTTNAAVGSTVKIHDSLGKLLNLSKTTSGSTNIEVEKLHSGLYHIAVIDFTGKVISTSFVIN